MILGSIARKSFGGIDSDFKMATTTSAPRHQYRIHGMPEFLIFCLAVF